MAMQSTEGKGKRITAEQFYDSQNKFDFSIEGQKSHRNIMEFAEAYSQSGAGPCEHADWPKHMHECFSCLKTGYDFQYRQRCALLDAWPKSSGKPLPPELSGAGSPEETKPTKCQHGVNYPHECKDCIFAEGHCQLASHSGLHPETDDCMNWWVVALPIGAASSSQSAAPTERQPISRGTALNYDGEIEFLKDLPELREIAEKIARRSAPEPPSQPRTFQQADCPKCHQRIAVEVLGLGGGSTGERAEPSEISEVLKFWDGQKYRFCPQCQLMAFRFAGEYAEYWLRRAALAEGSRTPDLWAYLEANYEEVMKWPGWMRGQGSRTEKGE